MSPTVVRSTPVEWITYEGYNGGMAWREITGWIVIAGFVCITLYLINDGTGLYTSTRYEAHKILGFVTTILILAWLWLNRK